MSNQYISDTVIGILSVIKPQTELAMDESLFGYKNNFASRDIAYALLEMESRLGIKLEPLIGAITESAEGFTVHSLIYAAALQKGAA